MRKRVVFATVITTLVAAMAVESAVAGRLEEVKQRGLLRCGILGNSAGQSMLNDHGEWVGFGIDYCRALAAAIFDDPNKVEFRPAALGQHLAALKSGELDILEATLTYTMSREVDLGFSFVGPTIYSGLTFMVPKSLKIASIKDLNGATICLEAGSLVEETLPTLFKANGITFKPLSLATPQQIYSMYDRSRCDAVTGDKSILAARRLERPHPADHVILEHNYGKSDSGPVVRSGDEAWLYVAKYTFYALVTAEELGITRENLEQMTRSPIRDVRIFLGLEGHDGTELGLRDNWTVSVVKAVGNYGEMWDRNLGSQSSLQLPRDENRLRRDGGLLFAPSWK